MRSCVHISTYAYVWYDKEIILRNIKFHHHLTWMDTAMHDMSSLGRTLQIDLPRDWASLALHRDVWRGVVSRC